MVRIERLDEAGAWQHFGNRALAHRPMFETRQDVVEFEAELGKAVRAGRIEIPCLSCVTTHFHGVARFPYGGMSAVLRDIESAYVLGFNARRDRDGPLVMGPFFSVRLFTDEDILRSIRYVDFNAVLAGLAKHPFGYESGSAFHYGRGSRPAWLDPRWVERFVPSVAGSASFRSEDYERQVLGDMTDEERRTIEFVYERLSRRGGKGLGPTEAVSGPVAAWIRDRCHLADGTAPGIVVAAPSVIETRITVARGERSGPWLVAPNTHARDGWTVVRSAALRFACALSLEEIAATSRTGVSTVRRLLQAHRTLMIHDQVYRAVFEEFVASILARTRPRG